MRQIPYGNTGLTVTKTGFGALPIQRRTKQDAVEILRYAYEAGFRLFDSARNYSDSEEKLGAALSDVRSDIVIATKTAATDRDTMLRHLDISLRNLKTDYIDIYQFHNPSTVPLEDSEGYKTMLELKEQGVIRVIGLTNHSADNAIRAAQSGLFQSIQYPLCCLASEKDLQVIEECRVRGIGMLGMKGLAGGLITRAELSFAFLEQFENVVPIWGIQHKHEAEEFARLDANPPRLNEEMIAAIDALQKELSGSFCRGCGYCLPCPAGINIPTSARMMFLLRRSVWENFVTPAQKEEMLKIDACLHCNACASRCPYHLDTPELLARNLADYKAFLQEKGL